MESSFKKLNYHSLRRPRAMDGHAFTLIELLVVIVIIGILGSVITASLGGARKQARDTKRVADLKNIAQALEEYYSDKGGTYPVTSDPSSNGGACIENDAELRTKLQPYLSTNTLSDPLYTTGGTTDYCYWYRTANSGQSFKIFAKTENQNNSAAEADGGTQNTPGNSLMYEVYSPDTASSQITFAPSVNYNGGTMQYGLLAEWKFDEGSGTTAADATGDGYNGTLIGGPTWVAGKQGDALSFDGIDDYVDISDISSMPLFSLSTWVNNATGGDSRHSIMRDFWEVASTELCYWSYSFANTYWRSTASGTIPDNTWLHVVTTWDGSVIRHYINGQLSWVDAATSSGTSQPLLTISGYGGRMFKGMLDDVRVYNKTLTASEVLQLYNSY